MIDSLENKVSISTPVTSQNNKPMKASTAHQILFSILPSSWTRREDYSNHYIDYIFEIKQAGLPKGIRFSAVIKLSTSLKVIDDSIILQLETEKIKYINDKTDEPVLIILINPKSEEVYWLFLQEYVHNILENSSPGWQNKKNVTLRLPIANQLINSTVPLEEAVLRGWEFIYVSKFHMPYRIVQEKIKGFFESPQNVEKALSIASNRPYGKHLSKSNSNCSSDSCSSCSQEPEPDISTSADNDVQLSLNHSQGLKLLDPRENRQAYYLIYNALNQAGDNISAGMRCTAMGEMAFYDYLLHFMRSFELEGTGSIIHLSRLEEHLRYFKAIDQLVAFIIVALDECELIPTSLLTIRLADTYLFATPYISRTFGQDKAAPLMDYAQSLLIFSHEIASFIESPGSIIQ
ncbi:hypothetical protein N752_11110 [Desulforamulus aquiferis]|nr:DUF4365 domain-containing protein [Desulforamulus aquiferis]RYD05114.1 hypothetical protein N752_11110 [Desulforamulus aquiferis]